jgi:hypothetical protein
MSRGWKITTIVLAAAAALAGWRFRDWLIYMWAMRKGE